MKCYSGIFWGQVTGQVFNKTTVLVLLFVFLFLPHRLGHLYCDYSTPCRGGRGTMTEAVTTHCECRETTVSYQQLQRCRPCPEWRPPLSASCHFLSEGFGSSSQFLRCHRSVLKKKTKQNNWVMSVLTWMKTSWGPECERFNHGSSATEKGHNFPIPADGSSDNESRWHKKPFGGRINRSTQWGFHAVMGKLQNMRMSFFPGREMKISVWRWAVVR